MQVEAVYARWAASVEQPSSGHGAEKSQFFSSRRRHPRCLSDWSSDVCSSDLAVETRVRLRRGKPRLYRKGAERQWETAANRDRKRAVEGKQVEFGGRRTIK